MSPDVSWIEKQWHLIRKLVGSTPQAGYYDADEVVAEENAGHVSVPDGVLGRVLTTDPSTEREKTTLHVAEIMAANLRHEEAVNQCHNLALELFMMFDQLGVPSALIWGTLWAETTDGVPQFALTPFVNKEAEYHRPGHSWIITPEFSVIDVALKHQAWVEGSYEEYRDEIPKIVTSRERISNRPPKRLWFTPPRRAATTDWRI